MALNQAHKIDELSANYTPDKLHNPKYWKLDDAINKCPPDGVIVQQQINSNNGNIVRPFVIIKSYEHLYNFMQKFNFVGIWTYNEVFLPTNKVKPFLDVDYHGDDTAVIELLQNFVSTITTDIVDIFNNQYKLNITHENVLISQAHKVHNKDEPPFTIIKYSFHVVVNSRFYYANNIAAKDLFLLLTIKNPLYKQIIDSSVYNKNHALRMIYSTKFDDYRPFFPIIDDTTHVYVKGIPTEYRTTEFACKYIVKHCNIPDPIIITPLSPPIENTTIDVVNISDNKITNVHTKSSYAKVKYLLSLLPSTYSVDYNLWNQIGMIIYNSTQSFELFDAFSRQSPLANYDYNNNKRIFDNYGKYAKTNRLDIGTLIWMIKQNKYANDAVVTNNLQRIEKETIIMSLDLIKPSENGMLIEQESQWVDYSSLFRRKSSPNMKFIVVNSEMGTGKTYNLIKALHQDAIKAIEKTPGVKSKQKHFLGNANGFKQVLFVSYRRSLAGKYKEDTNNLPGGYSLYSQISGLINCDKLICQVDSLHRINTRYCPDLIVLDEFNGILEHLTSSTIANPYILYTRLIHLISCAKHVIIMDANINGFVNKFIHVCQEYAKTDVNNDYVLINNTYKKLAGKNIHLINENILVDRLINDYRAGKRIAICSTVKSFVTDVIVPKLNEVRATNPVLLPFLVYTGDSSEADKLKVESTVNNCSCTVVYTPTVSSGVSFNSPDFETIYGYGMNIISHYEFIQMLNRVRTTRSNDIYITYKAANYIKKDAPMDVDELNQLIQHKAATLAGNKIFELIQQYDFGDNSNFANCAFKLFSISTVLHNITTVYFEELFNKLCLSKGYNIIDERTELIDFDYINARRQLINAAKLRTMVETINLTPLSPSMFMDIERSIEMKLPITDIDRKRFALTFKLLAFQYSHTKWGMLNMDERTVLVEYINTYKTQFRNNKKTRQKLLEYDNNITDVITDFKTEDVHNMMKMKMSLSNHKMTVINEMLPLIGFKHIHDTDTVLTSEVKEQNIEKNIKELSRLMEEYKNPLKHRIKKTVPKFNLKAFQEMLMETYSYKLVSKPYKHNKKLTRKYRLENCLYAYFTKKKSDTVNFTLEKLPDITDRIEFPSWRTEINDPFIDDND
jgi:hypothetical protein